MGAACWSMKNSETVPPLSALSASTLQRPDRRSVSIPPRRSVALSTLIETGEHDLLNHTGSVADAKVLARPIASEEFRVDNHRLTQFQ